MQLLLQLLVNGFINAALFSLMAIGFGLVYRSLYIFHIAYGALYVVGTYFLYIFAVILKIPIILSILLSICFTSVIGVIIEKTVYFPFYKKKSGSGAIMVASLGIYIVIENLIALIFGNEVKIASQSIEKSYEIGPILLTKIQIVEFIVSIFTIMVFFLFLKRVKIFKAIWAMGDQPELIPILGISLKKLRTIVFAISSAFIALPACLISIDIGMDPHTGMSYLLIAVVAVLFGGIDNFWGWVIGAGFLSEIQSLAIWKFSSRWTDLVTFLILIIFLLFKPEGMLGISKRAEE